MLSLGFLFGIGLYEKMYEFIEMMNGYIIQDAADEL